MAQLDLQVAPGYPSELMISSMTVCVDAYYAGGLGKMNMRLKQKGYSDAIPRIVWTSSGRTETTMTAACFSDSAATHLPNTGRRLPTWLLGSSSGNSGACDGTCTDAAICTGACQQKLQWLVDNGVGKGDDELQLIAYRANNGDLAEYADLALLVEPASHRRCRRRRPPPPRRRRRRWFRRRRRHRRRRRRRRRRRHPRRRRRRRRQRRRRRRRRRRRHRCRASSSKRMRVVPLATTGSNVKALLSLDANPGYPPSSWCRR